VKLVVAAVAAAVLAGVAFLVLGSAASGLPSGPSMQGTVTVDLSHYGPQQPPATPPSGQVLDLSNLAGATAVS
jgi:hypothetical protein